MNHSLHRPTINQGQQRYPLRQLSVGLYMLSIGVCIGAGLSACGTASTAATPTEEPGEVSTLAIDQWTYIQLDSTKGMWGEFDDPEWLRYFGLATGDVDGDGNSDIVTGRYVYWSPGGDLTSPWRREDVGRNVDANLILETGLGNRGSVLAEALPDVVLFEVHGDTLSKGTVVAQVPPTGHHNGQGYRTADVDGDGQDEVLYASLGGVFVIDPPTFEKERTAFSSYTQNWPVHLLAVDASDEGFAVADVDGDGDLDVVAGFRAPGGDPEVPTYVSWFENEGSIVKAWPRHHVGRTTFATDRIEAGDLDGDGVTDIAIAEERYPGLEPDASLWLYFQRDTGFVRELLVMQSSMNNLDFADMDRDGDLDIVTAEHKGDRLALQIWSNDGSGSFRQNIVDTGKENHLGAHTVDIDGDGDLDIVGIGWDRHEYVHLWRNDAIK